MPEQHLLTVPMWRVDQIEPSPETLTLRGNGPIHRVRLPVRARWWVIGYDEAKAVLSDAAFRPAGMPPAAFTPDSVMLGSPGARIRIVIDIGYGDATEPVLNKIELASLLDKPAPKLRAYPPEAVIAEK